MSAIKKVNKEAVATNIQPCYHAVFSLNASFNLHHKVTEY